MFGGKVLYDCPHCGTALGRWQAFSGSLVGAVHFSDGESHFPDMPTPDPLVCCGSCSGLIWTRETRSQSSATEASAEERPASEEELVNAIASGDHEDRELELRLAAWRSSLKEYRQRLTNEAEGLGAGPFGLEAHTTEPPRIEGARRSNMQALLELLEAQGEPSLVAVDLARQLSRWGKATLLLTQAASGGLSPAKVEDQRQWIAERDPRLRVHSD